MKQIQQTMSVESPDDIAELISNIEVSPRALSEEIYCVDGDGRELLNVQWETETLGDGSKVQNLIFNFKGPI